jgi:hypothetical protein
MLLQNIFTHNIQVFHKIGRVSNKKILKLPQTAKTSMGRFLVASANFLTETVGLLLAGGCCPNRLLSSSVYRHNLLCYITIMYILVCTYITNLDHHAMQYKCVQAPIA